MRRQRLPVKGPVIFIVGPTAIGKSAFAVKLAERVNGEIISADSMQVYKGMRILSQAPGPAERKKIKHHLIGIVDPHRAYSAAEFIGRASPLIDSIIKRKKTPIVVGGSGLYIKALVDGLFPSPKADLKFRKKMAGFVKRCGSAKLHKKLSLVDPEAAKKIHPNDTRRIIRALEVYNSTGATMTALKNQTRGLSGKYRIKMIGLTAPRDEIYARIDSRGERMFEEGLVKEVRRLRKKRLSKTARAALGLKEVAGYLDGEYGLAEAKEALKKNTRRLAKRQLTWFRADKRIVWNGRF